MLYAFERGGRRNEINSPKAIIRPENDPAPGPYTAMASTLLKTATEFKNFATSYAYQEMELLCK